VHTRLMLQITRRRIWDLFYFNQQSSLVDHFANAMHCWYVSWRRATQRGIFFDRRWYRGNFPILQLVFRGVISDLPKVTLNDLFRTDDMRYWCICTISQVDQIKGALNWSRDIPAFRNREWYYLHKYCSCITFAINR